jgi:hypothetical protein
MKTEKFYYALVWTYGEGVIRWRHGPVPVYCAASLWAFPSRQQRDAFLSDGPEYKTVPGYRSAIQSSHPFVRRDSLKARAQHYGLLTDDDGSPMNRNTTKEELKDVINVYRRSGHKADLG